MRTRTLLAVSAATAALALPAVAQAHSGVVRRTPDAGATVRNVTSVSITFSQRLVTGRLDVYRGGRRVAPRRSGPSGSRVSATFARRLAAGGYSVRWRAVASDGHVQTGSWSFRVK